MDAKSITNSRVTLSQLMGPQDANRLGNVHGGVIMKHVDEAGALAAMRHAQNVVVTVAVDSMTFKHPIRIGDVVTINAELTYVGRTSMEVRVEVTAEHPIMGTSTHTNSAYLVYVALDSEGHPCEVPPLKLETEQEKRRWEGAEQRQKFRKHQQAQEAALEHG
ncbi:MAG TPA: acyl-CoA thioesterase [Aggregatilineales bacterium]|nr:acyl-CoA thioesterase [Aggregatilineales bacterium]